MKKNFGNIVLSLLAIVLLAVSYSAQASIGVGVGAGRISLDSPIKPGTIYQLPSLPVINTGDEAADYAVSIEYNQTQPQMRPDPSWFSFSPSTFHLEPGKSQVVKISVAIPIKVVPGDYFGYLEAHPIMINVPGVSSIGVAAASKLYFTVAPANYIQGVYYRVLSLVKEGAPWTYIALGLIGLFILVRVFRRFFNFKIAIAVKK